jgi:hypothetical protein
LFFSRSSSL